MLRIGKLRSEFTEIVSGLEIGGITFSVNEQSITKQLTKATGVQVVLIYPTREGAGGLDNCKMMQRITILVLERNGGQSDTTEKEFERYERLENTLVAIFEEITSRASAGNGIFWGVDVNRRLIEPIYNLGGFDGWGMDLYF